MLKTYIEMNVANKFIKSSRFFSKIFIFWMRNYDKSFLFYINYLGFKNLIMKNWYLLMLINRLLDKLERAKQFIHLYITNIYHTMRIWELDKEKTVFKIRSRYYM